MRNDVKLGFAIGGVLLAVLIVYVLVVPGGANSQRQAKVDNTAKPDPKVTLEPVPSTQAGAPPSAPPGSFTPPDATAGAPTDVDNSTAGGEVALADEETPEPAPPVNAKQDDWTRILNGSPVLMTTPDAGRVDAQLTQGGEGRGSGLTSTPLSPPTPPSVPPLEPARMSPAEPPIQFEPTTRPTNIANRTNNSNGSSAAVRTHVVQANETLSSISIAAYGNANHWPAIVKANPGIDPDRLKVGTTIKLPAASDVKPADAQNAVARIGPAAQPIDARKQYRVQTGDNLHNISLRLYGKSTRANEIYELNKQLIGPDPARLKIGQVLQLPQAPTVQASR